MWYVNTSGKRLVGYIVWCCHRRLPMHAWTATQTSGQRLWTSWRASTKCQGGLTRLSEQEFAFLFDVLCGILFAVCVIENCRGQAELAFPYVFVVADSVVSLWTSINVIHLFQQAKPAGISY